MAQWAKDEDEIDVLVFAMRRIFGFDYWLGENNGEFGVSFHYHGQDFVRSPAGGGGGGLGRATRCEAGCGIAPIGATSGATAGNGE